MQGTAYKVQHLNFDARRVTMHETVNTVLSVDFVKGFVEERSFVKVEGSKESADLIKVTLHRVNSKASNRLLRAEN